MAQNGKWKCRAFHSVLTIQSLVLFTLFSTFYKCNKDFHGFMLLKNPQLYSDSVCVHSAHVQLIYWILMVLFMRKMCYYYHIIRFNRVLFSTYIRLHYDSIVSNKFLEIEVSGDSQGFSMAAFSRRLA